MSTRLSEVGRELYDQLTAGTFYVVDTEFAVVDGQNHLISIGIVPVVGGRRTLSRDELYRVMDPGVPIDAGSTAIHGFTDTAVRGKPPFARNRNVITKRLSDPEAVLVCHTAIDAHVLRAAYARDGQEPPDLPVLDTQRLAATIGYPGIRRGTKIRLGDLCDRTGVKRPAQAHNALHDARATADAFLELMRHISEHAVFWTGDALLDAAGAGNLRSPAGSGVLRKRRPRGADPLTAEHIARHATPLLGAIQPDHPELNTWLEMAGECARLRCPHLRPDARAAAEHNAALLLPALMEDLPHLTEPGQPATLLGAVLEMLTVREPSPPALQQRSILKWWDHAQRVISSTTACNRDSSTGTCPDCRDEAPCPRDMVFVAIAEAATLGGQQEMTPARAREITAAKQRSPLNTWRKTRPDILAYALWRSAEHLIEEADDEQAFHLVEQARLIVDQGIALGLHTAEPRFARLACERLVQLHGTEAAFPIADTVLQRRTTDPAYDQLRDWATFNRSARQSQQRRPAKPITHPRRARPAGRENPRRYS
jgi:DNA polymerase III epsilon subunit-like protein